MANYTDAVCFKHRSQVMESNRAPGWLALNLMNMSGAVQAEPAREDIELPLNEQLIVEYYSR